MERSDDFYQFLGEYMKYLQRYLTLEKFKWLCEDKGFFLAPLSRQSDPKEGIYDSQIPLDSVRDIVRDLFPSSKNSNPENLEAVKSTVNKWQNEMMKDNRDNVFISSWFIGEEESKEMWDNYSDNNGVILFSRTDLLYIESPEYLRKLGDSFVCKDVIYGDKEKSKINYQPAYYKNEEFLGEKEHRIIFDLNLFKMLTGQAECTAYIDNVPAHEYFQNSGAISKVNLDDCKEVLIPKGNGYIIKYNLSCVIKEVRVNAKASEQTKKEIQKLCKLNNLNFQESKLDYKYD